jgi:hypothetical protein
MLLPVVVLLLMLLLPVVVLLLMLLLPVMYLLLFLLLLVMALPVLVRELLLLQLGHRNACFAEAGWGTRPSLGIC